jgi:predicted DsbA family dithiol-disulfide isomerase
MLRSDFSRLRYGDVGKSRGGGTPGALVEQGREVGLDFDFARIPRMPNTFAGHRLLHFAAQTSANWRDQHALAEVLFSYHFCEQRDVGSHADLILAAAEAGLDTELAAACLETDAGAKAVQADLTRGRDYGVSGIPYLVFAGWFGLPGAQDSRTIGHFLQRARARVPHAG